VLLVHTEEAVVRSRFRPVWQRTLVRAQVLDAVTRSESAVLALRRQTTGPGGRLFPALDADLWLPPPGEHSARLSLAGVHRPPLGALGASLDRAITFPPMLRRGGELTVGLGKPGAGPVTDGTGPITAHRARTGRPGSSPGQSPFQPGPVRALRC